ncbi:dynamin family protein [Nostoc commune NIES-4072]|uniref:Dynamin family protein n=1 Tax=Nostoc commune NIES-4072 TaxID=2005467 RepID=A0A2R5FF79_NOSCO|nr:dynamin family protein [Nostoc commune HK-02]GBG17157.1 dynamin family protein [Nostoc commune NIES-4072]
MREIPCVLKYGIQKRVVCRYKDEREEEIPFEQYQLKATISEDAVLGCLSDELAHDEIDEIVGSVFADRTCKIVYWSMSMVIEQ